MKRLLAASWVLCVVAVVASTVLWQQLRMARARQVELTARVDALEMAGRNRGAAWAAERQRPAAPDASQSRPTPGSASSTSAQAAAGTLAAAVQRMTETPAGEEFQRVMARQTLLQQYPDMQGVLGIPAATAERLMDLLVRQLTEQRSRRTPETERAVDQEIAALLGDRLEAWREYQRSGPGRLQQRWRQQQAEELRAAISPPGNPLPAAMFDPLVKALDAEQRRIEQESQGLAIAAQLQRQAADQQRLLEVASAYLNADQMQRYRHHLDGQAQVQRATMGMMEEAARGAGAAPVATP